MNPMRRDQFFRESFINSNGLIELNTNIWNNHLVFNVTQYSIEDIKECIYDLAVFISQNFSPSGINCFDLDSILETQNIVFEQQMMIPKYTYLKKVP